MREGAAAGRALAQAGDLDGAGRAYAVALAAAAWLQQPLQPLHAEIEGLVTKPPLAVALAAGAASPAAGPEAARAALARSDALLAALRGRSTSPMTRGLAAFELGNNARLRGDLPAARVAYEGAIVEFAAAGEPRWSGRAEVGAALCRLVQHDIEGGGEAMEKALLHLRAGRAPFLHALALRHLGELYSTALPEEAARHLASARAAFASIERRDWEAHTCLLATRVTEGWSLATLDAFLGCIESARAVADPRARFQLLHDAEISYATFLSRTLERTAGMRQLEQGPAPRLFYPSRLDPSERARVTLAIGLLDEVMLLAPSGVWLGAAQLQRARLLLAVDRAGEALSVTEGLNDSLRGNPPGQQLLPEVLELRAVALERLSRLSEAAAALEELARMAPASDDLSEVRSFALVSAAGLHARAGKLPDNMLPGRGRPSNPERAALNEAIRLLRQVLTKNAKRDRFQLSALHQLVQIHAVLGQPAELAAAAEEYVARWTRSSAREDPSLPTPIEVLRHGVDYLSDTELGPRSRLRCLLGERLAKLGGDDRWREAADAFQGCSDGARRVQDEEFYARAELGLGELYLAEDPRRAEHHYRAALGAAWPKRLKVGIHAGTTLARLLETRGVPVGAAEVAAKTALIELAHDKVMAGGTLLNAVTGLTLAGPPHHAQAFALALEGADAIIADGKRVLEREGAMAASPWFDSATIILAAVAPLAYADPSAGRNRAVLRRLETIPAGVLNMRGAMLTGILRALQALIDGELPTAMLHIERAALAAQRDPDLARDRPGIFRVGVHIATKLRNRSAYVHFLALLAAPALQKLGHDDLSSAEQQINTWLDQPSAQELLTAALTGWIPVVQGRAVSLTWPPVL
ncbi:hypothetical protein [Sorangium sp. So ce131]|uniref:hypothetical protein n=1 Tax=Sorangium sp. So ce131 TaxID=3133282 RepID=UPI003F6405AC